MNVRIFRDIVENYRIFFNDITFRACQ